MNRRLKKALLELTLPKPATARHSEYSMIFSADDQPGAASRRLIDLSVDAISLARDLKLDELRRRTRSEVDLINLWPGEQHRLLAALVKVLAPKRIVEIGTGAGGTTLAMLATLPAGSSITTFDVIAWQNAPEGVLQQADFDSGRLKQHVDDVTVREGFDRYRPVFAEADFIAIDAAKDGQMEGRLIEMFRAFPFSKPPVFFFDDIRVWNMLRFWRDIPWPKLDLTSFGHWTGTGLAEWEPS
jgi:O-methyltransferase